MVERERERERERDMCERKPSIDFCSEWAAIAGIARALDLSIHVLVTSVA